MINLSKFKKLYPDVVKKLLKLFSWKHKKLLVVVLIINTVNSIVCVIGIASIMPFVSLLANPNQIKQNKILSLLYSYSRINSIQNFMLAMGIIVLLVFLFTNAFMAFNSWVNIKFARSTSINLASGLMARYVSHDYEYFLNKNSSELMKNIFSECLIIVGKIIQPGINMISYSILAVSIIIFIAIISPGITFSIIILLGGLYAVIFAFMRKKLLKVSHKSVESSALKYKAANEIFGGIKDIKLLNKELSLLKIYNRNVKIFEKNQATIYLFQTMPKFLLESIAFGGMLSIVLILYAVKKDLTGILPFIAIYALAAYRLMPSMEFVFRGLTSIRGSIKSLDIVYNDYLEAEKLLKNRIINIDNVSVDTIQPLEFVQYIELLNIKFKYKTAKEYLTTDFNLKINANTTNAFVGTTGCGKTTIIDIILTLLKPESGKIIVDGVEITAENEKNWRKNIGYVPQQIYLSDDSISKNIAFGLDNDSIDMDAVINAAKTANIHDFIMNELPGQYSTIVGERGVRLSGGQRQRIGIARALYHDPKVLVLDEATSALDNITEHAVMEAIDKLAGKKTILMIAHRLSTVKKCDNIFLLDKGVVADHGKYSELEERHETFREVASRG